MRAAAGFGWQAFALRGRRYPSQGHLTRSLPGGFSRLRPLSPGLVAPGGRATRYGVAHRRGQHERQVSGRPCRVGTDTGRRTPTRGYKPRARNGKTPEGASETVSLGSRRSLQRDPQSLITQAGLHLFLGAEATPQGQACLRGKAVSELRSPEHRAKALVCLPLPPRARRAHGRGHALHPSGDVA